MTRAEALFWNRLKKRQKTWEHQFQPQQVVYGYIPDFYCETLKLAVEIDGKVHDRKDVKRNDRLRTRRLKKQGVTVIRFRNADVFTRAHRLIDLLEEVSAGYTQYETTGEPERVQ
jgi:very-short-patch-repair endonuclease